MWFRVSESDAKGKRKEKEKKGEEDNYSSAKGDCLDQFQAILQSSALMWRSCDSLPLPPHPLSAATPADIHSFRHGDLPALNHHVESTFSALHLFIIYRYVCLLCCSHGADIYMKCSLLLPGLRVIEIDKRDLSLTVPALILLYFLLYCMKASGQ